MASGLFIAVLCFAGCFGSARDGAAAAGDRAILLYIGLLIGAQAFQSTPRLHAAAVVAAIIPNLAAWGAGLIDNALSAAGTTAAQVGDEALGNAGLVYHGLHVLGQGATLAGIVLGAIVTFILGEAADAGRGGRRGGRGAVLGSVCCTPNRSAGRRHPAVALGYAFLAIVLIGIGLVQGPRTTEPEIADIQSDPVPTAGGRGRRLTTGGRAAGSPWCMGNRQLP